MSAFVEIIFDNTDNRIPVSHLSNVGDFPPVAN